VNEGRGEPPVDPPRSHFTGVLVCSQRIPCAVCEFLILPGEDMILDPIGWVHPTCSEES
jgi:hypothetical protein